MSEFFNEYLHTHYGQFFVVDRVLYQSETEHQQLIVFENHRFGRVLVLDGIVQTTEGDEFIYHEMLAHVPLFAHGMASEVLIIGGGDGGCLREVLKHSTVQRTTQIEIDATVIELSKQYLPKHSQGAFDDSRTRLIIADGIDYLSHCDERFDIIISDSTDPVGPGEVLFSEAFYRACKRCLNPDGILVTQNGVPFFQLDEAVDTSHHLRHLFAEHHFYSAAVPTYAGGIMAFGWATDALELRRQNLDTLQARFQASGIHTRYYNPAIHQASFALPQYLLEAIQPSA